MSALLIPKSEPIRSRQVLDSAKGQPCTMLVPEVCCRDPEKTVSCHVGRYGLGLKADDTSTFHGCWACHEWLDQRRWIGKMPEVEVVQLVLRAVLRTIRARVELGIYPIKLDKPKGG